MTEGTDIKDLFSYAMIILIAIIAMSLGADILQEIKDGADNDVAAHPNETLSWAGNNTPISLATGGIVSGSFILYNDNEIMGSNNYSLDTTGGVLTPINVSESGIWITSGLNASYAYYYGSHTKNITGYGLITQITMAKWMPTIALVLIISVIIGILITYLARRFT